MTTMAPRPTPEEQRSRFEHWQRVNDAKLAQRKERRAELLTWLERNPDLVLLLAIIAGGCAVVCIALVCMTAAQIWGTP